MFIHIIKDYHKKLDAIEQRLAVSLDRDEIQTLGLKLRFYHNEIKHYRSILAELHNRIADIQEKYGFAPEEDRETLPSRTSKDMDAGEKNENIAAMVSDWITRLEGKGLDPAELLKSSGAALLKEQKKSGAAEQKPSIETQQPPPKTPMTAIPPQSAALMYTKSRLPSEEKPGADEEIVSIESGKITDMDEAVPESEGYAALEDSVLEKELGSEIQAIEAETDNDIEKAAGIEPDDGAAPAPETELQSMDFAGDESADEVGIVGTIKKWVTGLLSGDSAACEIESAADDLADRLTNDMAEMISGWPNEEFALNFRPEESGLAAYCAARVLKSAGRSGAAINLLESALRRRVESAEMYLLLGGLYYEKELPGRALQYYGKARELGAGMEAVMDRWLGCLRESGDWRAIIADVEAFEHAGDTRLLMLKAEALHGTGNNGEALRLLEELMGREDIPGPDRAGSAILLGKIREDKGDILGAIDFYEKSFELNPDNPQAHFELGRLYFKHNAVPLAKNQMMSLLKKFPESDWTDKARKLMAQEGVL